MGWIENGTELQKVLEGRRRAEGKSDTAPSSCLISPLLGPLTSAKG